MSTTTDNNKRTILVTGATGNQGGAVIKALLASPDISNLRILALTRSTTSPSAQRLGALHPSIHLHKGDLSAAPAIFTTSPFPINAVFSIQAATPGTTGEQDNGTALIAAAITHRHVTHFVQTSSDRGGPLKSIHHRSQVPNFIAKYEIEKYLEAYAGPTCPNPAGQHMTYAILRPVTFMENLTLDLHGGGFARMWEQMGEDKPLQLVAVADIGHFAAEALLHPERYAGKALSLAGDQLTQPQGEVIFKKVVGKTMPLAPCLIASALKAILPGQLGSMFAWFKEEGYGADVEECRREWSGMMDFEAWLRQSAWVAGAEK